MATVLAYRRAEPEQVAAPWALGLSELVETTGITDFGSTLLAFFDQRIGADHCTVYQLKNYEFAEVFAVSSACAELIPKTCFSTYDVKRRFRQFGSSEASVELYLPSSAANVAMFSTKTPQGIFIFGCKGDSLFCVRILRRPSTYAISDLDLSGLREVADLIISLVARHQGLIHARLDAFSALISLDTIEQRILDTKSLSKREAEVCARILFGCSSCEIASDLGIGKESVMTYRKRAYQHLEIGSQRELLLWYLGQRSGVTYN
ncbi:MAG: hypothetical protein JWO15_2406 [Sphingomonadales bacterium]|nr:hypothetical protein [Sphingomonadales bacterium]